MHGLQVFPLPCLEEHPVELMMASIGLTEWENERPLGPSYLRILYLGKMLQDEVTLARAPPKPPLPVWHPH